MPSGRQKVDGSGGDGTDQGGEVMIHQWVDCDRSFVSRRYDRIAGFIPLFDRLLFLPPSLRAQAVARMGLRRGDSVLDLGCGTGTNLSRLRQAVGPSGHVFGIDISPGMLRSAAQRQSLAQCRIDRMRCRRLYGAATARWRADEPVVHHAAPPRCPASRVAAASAGRPHRHQWTPSFLPVSANEQCSR